MTIVFRGHVERIETGFNGRLDVHVQTEQDKCGQTLVLHVPAEAAAHWLPGRMVSITAYAYDLPKVHPLSADEPGRNERAATEAYAEGCKRGA